MAREGQGCVELCKPGLTDDTTLSGTAVMFRGDSYDDNTFAVSNSTDDSFNIACYGTVISKMHFLRHTSAAMGTAAFPVTQRQAMLRMLTGDYCGNGHSFTSEGHPIRIGFGHAAFQPRSEFQPDVGLGSARSLDAMWRTDGTRASCIGAPRLSDVPGPDVTSTSVEERVREIQDYCNEQYLPVPSRCEANRWGDAKSGNLGDDYLMSANLFSAPSP